MEHRPVSGFPLWTQEARCDARFYKTRRMATNRPQGDDGVARVPCRCCDSGTVTIEKIQSSQLREILPGSNQRMAWEDTVAELGGDGHGGPVEWFICPRCGYDWIETAWVLVGREGRVEHLMFAALSGDSFSILLRIEPNPLTGEEEVAEERCLRGHRSERYPPWYAALMEQRRHFVESLKEGQTEVPGAGCPTPDFASNSEGSTPAGLSRNSKAGNREGRVRQLVKPASPPEQKRADPKSSASLDSLPAGPGPGDT